MFSLKTRAGRDTCQPGQWKRFSISRKIFCIEENVSPLFLVLLAKMIGTWGFVFVANVDFQDWNSFLASKDAHQLLDVLYMNRHFSFVYMQCFVWGLASSTHPMNMSHFGISPESSCTAVGWTPEILLRFLLNSTFLKILPTMCCWLILGLRLSRIHSQTK